jgi:WD40 repeat protein
MLVLTLITFSGQVAAASHSPQSTTQRVTVQLKDGEESEISQATFKQLIAASKTIANDTTYMENQRLTLQEIPAPAFAEIVQLIKHINRVAALLAKKKRIFSLAKLLTYARFLDASVLENALEKRIKQLIRTEKSIYNLDKLKKNMANDNLNKALLNSIESKRAFLMSKKNANQIKIDPAAYNFILQDGILNKPLTDKNRIDILIESSQMLKDMFNDMENTQSNVFYMDTITQKTFEQLYLLIEDFNDSKKINTRLADNKTYSIRDLANMLNAANFFDINILMVSIIQALAARLLLPSSLEQLKNGARWPNDLQIPAELDFAITSQIKNNISMNNIIYTLFALEGHTSDISSIGWSPDGKNIVTGSWDNTANIWNAQTGTFIRKLSQHTDIIYAVAWSPNGNLIATASSDRTACLWDAATGKRVHTLSGHTNEILFITWSPDSAYLATGSYDRQIKIWNSKTGTLVREMAETIGISSIAWSPDGKYLAIGLANGTIKLMDPASWSVARSFSGSPHDVKTLAWSPISNHLAAGSADGIIRIWNAQTGQIIHSLKGHADAIGSVSWNYNEKYLASGSTDTENKIWNAKTGAFIRTFYQQSSATHCVAWSPIENNIATGSEEKMPFVFCYLDADALKSITLDQILLIALARDLGKQNKKLELNSHLQKIFDTMSPAIQEFLVSGQGVKKFSEKPL